MRLQVVLDPESPNADPVSMFLANTSRDSDVAKKLISMKGLDDHSLVFTLCDIFCKGPAFNPNAKYHCLGSVLFNVTQTAAGRNQIMLRAGEGCLLQRLLPFTTHESTIRRGGVIGCLRNCCFNSNDHEWLLSDEVNLLPHILLPLIGPEDLDEDDMDGMPDELQYQPPDKKREEDADLRKFLVETLAQLTAREYGRTLLRDRKVYPILREYHKWEPEEDVQEAILQVVQVLITPEMETALPEGVDDLNEVTDEMLKERKKEQGSAVVQIGAPEGYYINQMHNKPPDVSGV